MDGAKDRQSEERQNETPYPLNPEKSDLFYFLLIRTKRQKLPKLQRAVSSSSALLSIKCIPRDTTTLAFLLILLQNANSRGMRKSLLKVPTVVDFFANSLIIVKYLFYCCCFVFLSLCCRRPILPLLPSHPELE